MKLLLIDDDIVDLINTKKVLARSRSEIEITESQTAEEGIHLAAGGGFDIILLDYQLPTMTGLEVLGLLQKSPTHNAAVVMLSHTDDEELAIKCLESGAQDFIMKSEVSAKRLNRAILHAKERNRIELQLHESNKQLRQLAEADTLTGLANRYVFEGGIRQALSLASRQQKNVALLMLDLDKFKQVNDTLGHSAGDQLLQEVSHRLRSSVRDEDLLCRLGGDEFSILVNNLDDINSVQILAKRILSCLSEPVIIDGHTLNISVSIGIATYPECADNPIQLMSCADIALYKSKEGGRNQAHYYSSETHQQVHNRIQLENDLHKALERDEFVIHYQPQIRTDTMEVTCAKALIRWNHPTRGLIQSDDFIPLAEDIGIIRSIEAWVLNTCCDQLAHWRSKHNSDEPSISLAMSLSTAQINLAEFILNIKNTLGRHGIPGSQLQFQLTEAAIANFEQSKQLLSTLSKIGIQLAMDNFCSENASLMKIKNHPFNTINIDKSIIQGDTEDTDNLQFLNAIHAFASTLNINVVAGGIETEAQKDACQQQNIYLMQGHYFSMPLPAEEFEQHWLSTPSPLWPVAQTML